MPSSCPRRVRVQAVQRAAPCSRSQQRGRQIHHVVLPPFEPEGITDVQLLAQKRKAHAKSGVMRGLSQAAPDDLVIVSDLDEIPRHEVIDQLARCTGWTAPVELVTTPFIYDFGCPETQPFYKKEWRRAKVVYRKELEADCDGPLDGAVCVDELRDDQRLGLGLFRVPTSITRAGWHMSYFMSEEKIQEKIGSYAHVERDTAANRDINRIKCYIYECKHFNQKDYGYRSLHASHGPEWVHHQAYVERNPTYVEYYERPLDPDACRRFNAAASKPKRARALREAQSEEPLGSG